jgi:hypothetical protein
MRESDLQKVFNSEARPFVPAGPRVPVSAPAATQGASSDMAPGITAAQVQTGRKDADKEPQVLHAPSFPTSPERRQPQRAVQGIRRISSAHYRPCESSGKEDVADVEDVPSALPGGRGPQAGVGCAEVNSEVIGNIAASPNDEAAAVRAASADSLCSGGGI